MQTEEPSSQTMSVFARQDKSSYDIDNIELAIDQLSLQQCPIQDNLDIYSRVAEKVTHLNLIEIPEEDVGVIFAVFKNIQFLTLRGLVLLREHADGYPSNLHSLVISDCRINRDLINDWYSNIGFSLKNIELCRSHYMLSLDHEGSLAEPHFLSLLPNVRHLTLKESGVLRFASPGNTQELFRLELVAKKCVINGKLLYLKYLSYDVFDKVDEVLQQLDCKESLTTLVLRNCPRKLNILFELTNLQHLRILNLVDPQVMIKLKTLPKIVTLDVHCAYPAKENQLMMLDDDSFIQILSHLSLDDYIALMQTSERLYDIICHHLLPNTQVKITDSFTSKYPVEQCLWIYETLGTHVRSLILSCDQLERVLPYFVSLKQLYLPHRQNDHKALDLIPHGLTQLDLYIHHENQSLGSLFQRLDRTLNSLDICGPFNPTDLMKLHNIRQLKFGGFTPSSMNIVEFFKQNPDLELLEMKFHDIEADYDSDDEEPLSLSEKHGDFSMCPMKRLKVLRLQSIHKKLSLDPADFPALEELRLTFDMYASQSVVNSLVESALQFTHLKTLHINGIQDYRQLYHLKNLRSLEIYEEFIAEEYVLDIVKYLPQLKTLGLENETYSLSFEVELQKLMVASGREITLYHCVWPTTKIRFG